MILDKIYNDFVSHTNLTDGLYKTVFIQISDILNLFKDIKWLRLKYTIDDQVVITEFFNKDPVPLYVIEIIQNLFNNSFTFPENSIIILDVEYNGREYSITCKNNIIDIPSDIQFITDYSLFVFFLIIRNVHDIFREFDNLFSFTDNFKLKLSSIYTPLQEQFKKQTIKAEIDYGIISSSTISHNQTLIETLRSRRKSLLNTLEVVMKEREGVIRDKSSISQIVRAGEGLELEKNILKEEYAELKRIYDTCLVNFDKVLDVIAEIDAELAGLNSVKDVNNIYVEELDHLISKKDAFVSEKIVLSNSSKDTKALMDTTLVKLNEISSKLKKAQSYSKDDLLILESKITELANKQEQVYTELMTSENEIKNQTRKVFEDSAKMEHVSSVGVSDVVNTPRITQSIVDHLINPLQPTSVIVVLNYLRYYFSYHTTNIASTLVTIYKDVDIGLLQALACRLTLTKYFGVYFNNMFSLVDFTDNRVRHVSVLEAN